MCANVAVKHQSSSSFSLHTQSHICPRITLVCFHILSDSHHAYMESRLYSKSILHKLSSTKQYLIRLLIFLSGWFVNSKNPASCVTRLRTLVLIGCCSSSIEINYHNKCYIRFFKLYVLCLFSITKLVVLLNWPVAQTSNRKLVQFSLVRQKVNFFLFSNTVM